jgi:hypothetical protein
MAETSTKTKETSAKKEGPYGQIFFQWQIPEYMEHVRSTRWYIAMVALALIFIVYSIFTANFLFALIIILIVFIVFLKSYAPPRILNFQITDNGLVLGNQFYPYDKIKNFYIIYKPPAVKKIFFDLKGFSPSLSIWLDDMSPLPIREKLLENLEEDLEKERQNMDDILETLLKL